MLGAAVKQFHTKVFEALEKLKQDAEEEMDKNGPEAAGNIIGMIVKNSGDLQLKLASLTLPEDQYTKLFWKNIKERQYVLREFECQGKTQGKLFEGKKVVKADNKDLGFKKNQQEWFKKNQQEWNSKDGKPGNGNGRNGRNYQGNNQGSQGGAAAVVPKIETFPYCANCEGNHFTNQCRKLKANPPVIDKNIQDKVIKNGICIKCLWTREGNHRCDGYWINKKGEKIPYVCDKCVFTTNSGVKLKMHKKVCYCALKRAVKPQPAAGAPPVKKTTWSAAKKQRGKHNQQNFQQDGNTASDDEENDTDNDEENDENEETILQSYPGKGTKFNLIKIHKINGMSCGSASQYIEDVQVFDSNGKRKILKCLYDLGSTNSTVEDAMGRKCAVQQQEVEVYAQTIAGKVAVDTKFTLILNTVNGRKQADMLGVPSMNQQHDTEIVHVPK
jgi:hypothetical protein